MTELSSMKVCALVEIRFAPMRAPGERVSKHRVSALGLFLGSFVLNDIPVLNQDSVFHADNIRRNPVDRKPEAREEAVDDAEVPPRDYYSWLIPEGGRDALDQAEETVAARLNVRTVLNIVGRPEALRCCIVRLSKTSSGFILSHFG